MIERTDDLWLIYDTEPWSTCCVTTNGFVRNNRAVMGRGVAKQAVERWPDIPARLGRQLLKEGEPGPFGSTAPPYYGNHVQFIGRRLVTFPVKPRWGTSDGQNVISRVQGSFPPGALVPGYLMKADLELIKRSLDELTWMYHNLGWNHPLQNPETGEITHPLGGGVYLPRPGCGAGELDWETQVKPLCEQYGDWLIVVNKSQ